MSHTPGPWSIAYDGPSLPIILSPVAKEDYVAFVRDAGGNAESNASLIAAAPDLLAALKDCCAALGGIKANPDAIPASAIAAIAKAEGR